AARALGDLLVVGVNSDASVRSLNKSPDRPIVGEAERAEVLAALNCVDYVVIFSEPDPLNLITTLQPDVLVKGGDWTVDRIVGRDVVERRGGTVKTIPLVPGKSTTALIQRIRSQPQPRVTHLARLPNSYMVCADCRGAGPQRRTTLP